MKIKLSISITNATELAKIAKSLSKLFTQLISLILICTYISHMI